MQPNAKRPSTYRRFRSRERRSRHRRLNRRISQDDGESDIRFDLTPRSEATTATSHDTRGFKMNQNATGTTAMQTTLNLITPTTDDTADFVTEETTLTALEQRQELLAHHVRLLATRHERGAVRVWLARRARQVPHGLANAGRGERLARPDQLAISPRWLSTRRSTITGREKCWFWMTSIPSSARWLIWASCGRHSGAVLASLPTEAANSMTCPVHLSSRAGSSSAETSFQNGTMHSRPSSRDATSFNSMRVVKRSWS